ncbi:MAG: hypothetical protein ACFCD0_13065 [Gemmataceae bacterium]
MSGTFLFWLLLILHGFLAVVLLLAYVVLPWLRKIWMRDRGIKQIAALLLYAAFAVPLKAIPYWLLGAGFGAAFWYARKFVSTWFGLGGPFPEQPHPLFLMGVGGGIFGAAFGMWKFAREEIWYDLKPPSPLPESKPTSAKFPKYVFLLSLPSVFTTDEEGMNELVAFLEQTPAREVDRTDQDIWFLFEYSQTLPMVGWVECRVQCRIPLPLKSRTEVIVWHQTRYADEGQLWRAARGLRGVLTEGLRDWVDRPTGVDESITTLSKQPSPDNGSQ